MNHWITVIYNEERAQEASFYQRAFQERGYRWITDTAKDTLLLSDAAVFIWSEGLRADPHAQELLSLCRERKIPVLFVHYELSGLPADDQIMDAGKTSFEDFERALEEIRSFPKVKRDREKDRRQNIFAAVLVFIAAAFLIGFLSKLLPPVSSAVSAEPVSESEEILSKYGNSVVQVWTIGSFGDSVFRGTGFAVTEDGYIVTNAHVVDHPSSRYRIVAGQEAMEAELTAVSEEQDIALLKVSGYFPQYLSFDDGEKEYGYILYAVGYPENKRKTAAEGYYLKERIENGKGRYEVIVMDLKPGNSGSPVIGRDGKVAGIASAVSKDNEEIGFMVPADVCMEFLKDKIFLK